jgi:hypothetical protein
MGNPRDWGVAELGGSEGVFPTLELNRMATIEDKESPWIQKIVWIYVYDSYSW